MSGVRDEIPQGTLDMLILRTLAQGGPRHGFEIADAIQQASLTSRPITVRIMMSERMMEDAMS